MDYWDNLGWKDPFGSKAHTKRQKAYVKKLGNRGLATPQLLVENRQSSRNYTETILAEAKKPARVVIMAGLDVVERKLTAKIRLERPTEGFPERAVVLPVLFQKKAVTKVTAGENEGKTLTEHFIVRKTVGPYPAKQAIDGTLTVEMDLPEGVAKENLGFAVLVEDQAAMITLESAAYDL